MDTVMTPQEIRDLYEKCLEKYDKSVTVRGPDPYWDGVRSVLEYVLGENDDFKENLE